MLDSQKYTIKNRKQNQSQKLQYIYVYEIRFKNRVFFFKVIVG